MRALLLLALALPLSACDGSDDDAALGGTYVGSAMLNGIGLAIELTIPGETESGPFTISDGAATLSFGGDPTVTTFTGTGTYTPPAATFDLDTGDAGIELPLSSGTVSEDGSAISVSAEGQTLTLRRQ